MGSCRLLLTPFKSSSATGRPNLLGVAILLCCMRLFALPAPTFGQESATIVAYVGGFFPDGDLVGVGIDNLLSDLGESDPIRENNAETGLIVGGRFALPLAGPWRLVGNYGYATFDSRIDIELVGFPPTANGTGFIPDLPAVTGDHDAHLYYGAIQYLQRRGARARPFAYVGAGGLTITRSFPGFEGLLNEESTTNFLVSIGGGIAIELHSAWGIRVGLRDHIQLCDEFDGVCFEDGTLHNVELSADVEFRP